MRALVGLLVASRHARRDAAAARVQAAARALDSVRQAQNECDSALLQALAWQRELRDEPHRPGMQDWRQARQLACLAVAERAVQDLIARRSEVAHLEGRLRERRNELTACERALLRTDELAGIVRQASLKAIESQEQSDCDDLSPTRASHP